MAVVMLLAACEGTTPQTDPREVFVGDYSFSSKGDIDLYAGKTKIFTVPLDKEGEMSITLSDQANAVWIVAEGDTAIAYVSGNQLFMDPTTEDIQYGDVNLHLKFTYGKATLEENQLTLPTDVEVSATYQSLSVSGSGKVDVSATKK